MAPIEENFVQIVKTFQLSEAKTPNTKGKVCDRCRRDISDQPQNGSSDFSRRDFQSYIYQSSSRKGLLSYLNLRDTQVPIQFCISMYIHFYKNTNKTLLSRSNIKTVNNSHQSIKL